MESDDLLRMLRDPDLLLVDAVAGTVTNITDDGFDDPIFREDVEGTAFIDLSPQWVVEDGFIFIRYESTGGEFSSANLYAYLVGEDEGRLFRAWAKRRLCTASSDPVEDFTEKRRQLAQVIEGFRLLHNLGVAVELYSPQFISYDPKQGMFIARFPFLREDSPGRSEFYPYFIDYAAPPEPEDFPADKAFLIQLGVFIGVYLVKEVPFVEPPLVSRWKNAPVVRKSLSLPCPLRSVLERLTELEPDKNYPDLAIGLEEVKLALLAGL